MTRPLLHSAALAVLVTASWVGAPAGAQDPRWQIEPPARNTAATVIRVLDDNTFFGFTCHRRRWSLFVNHIPPEGGACADHHACEVALGRVANHIAIGEAPEREAAFDLFENTYYKAGEVTRDEMASVLKAPTIAIRLDPRLAEVWGRERLELPIDGLSEALDAAGRRFDCPR